MSRFTDDFQLDPRVLGDLAKQRLVTEQSFAALVDKSGVAPEDVPGFLEALALAGLLAAPDSFDPDSDEGDPISVPYLLDGASFAHRLTEDDLEGQRVESFPDFSAVDLLVDSGFETDSTWGRVDAGTFHFRFEDGPPPDVRAGELLEVTVEVNQASIYLDLEIVEDADRNGFTEGELTAALKVLDPLLDEATLLDEPLPVIDSEHAALALLDAGLVGSKDQPPIADLFEALGLEVWGAKVGREGSQTQLRKISRANGLRNLGPGAIELDELLSATFAGGGDTGGLAGQVLKLTALCAKPGARRLLIDLAEEDPELAAEITEILDPGDPAALLIEAIEAMHSLDSARESSLLEAARKADPRCPVIAFYAGLVADDQGRARDAMSAYRVAEIPSKYAGDPYSLSPVAVVSKFTRPYRSDESTARNAPCPCGSGKKFKLCHMKSETYPLGARAGWVYSKLVRASEMTGHHEDRIDRLYEIFEAATAEYDSVDFDLFESVSTLLAIFDPVDDGAHAIEIALELRGGHYPADEVEMLKSWMDVHCAIWEVLGIDEGKGMTMRPYPDGEVTYVTEQVATYETQAGDLLFTCVVPAGDEHRIVGGVISVPRMRRDLIDWFIKEAAHPVVLVAALSVRSAPELRNTDSEVLVPWECRIKPAEMSAAIEILASTDEIEADEDGEQFTRIGPPPNKWIRGGAILEEGKLRFYANSQERREWLEDNVISRIESEVGIESRVELDIDEMSMLSLGPGGGPPLTTGKGSVDLDDLTPEQIKDVTAQISDELARRWCDDSIPALDGMTPREARKSPEMLQRLEALLDDFDSTDRNMARSAGDEVMMATMNVELIRKELDLPLSSFTKKRSQRRGARRR